MYTITSIVKRYPIVTFFVLAYAFSWWGWVLGTLAPAIAPFTPYPFASYGPLLAALIVIAVTAGRSGFRALGASMLKWHVTWRWYAVALGIPLAVALSAIALNVMLGAPAPSLAQLGPWYMPVLVFALRLINPLDGPLGEEPGWRGSALPRLQAGRAPLTATLILGLLVAGWHLPLVLAHQLPPIGLLATIAVTFWYAWIYNHTGGSGFMTLVAHAAEGVFFTFAAAGFVGAIAARGFWLYAVVWCVVAIGLVIVDWSAWRSPLPVAPREALPTEALLKP